MSLFDGNSPLGSAESDPGVGGFTPVTLANGDYSFARRERIGRAAPARQRWRQYLVSTILRRSRRSTVDAALPVTVADGATVAIDGASAQSVTFTGSTGTLKLDDAHAFTGQVSGLAGSDAIDLADVSYGPNTTATFLGNTERRHAHRHQRDADCKHCPRRRLSIVILDGVQRWKWRHHRRRSDVLQHLAADQYRRRRVSHRYGRRSRWRDGGAH